MSHIIQFTHLKCMYRQLKMADKSDTAVKPRAPPMHSGNAAGNAMEMAMSTAAIARTRRTTATTEVI